MKIQVIRSYVRAIIVLTSLSTFWMTAFAGKQYP